MKKIVFIAIICCWFPVSVFCQEFAGKSLHFEDTLGIRNNISKTNQVFFDDVDGSVLSEVEMERVTGSLFVFGTRILSRIKRVNRKQRTTNPKAVHCDIVAQNRADDLGLNTSNQDGSQSNYNAIKVKDIYTNFPQNRHTQPPEGSAGYVFTAYGGDMQHLETYSRPAGNDDYTRYSNRSYPETENAANMVPCYTPPGVTNQVFIPLPKRPYYERYCR